MQTTFEIAVTWRLSIGKKSTGLTIEPDARWPTMWRIHFAGQVSDIVNLTRSKDAAVAWVRPKGLAGEEVAHWHRRETATEAPPRRFRVARAGKHPWHAAIGKTPPNSPGFRARGGLLAATGGRQ